MFWVAVRFVALTVPLALLIGAAQTGALARALKPTEDAVQTAADDAGKADEKPPFDYGRFAAGAAVGVTAFAGFALFLFFYALRWMEDGLTLANAAVEPTGRNFATKLGLLMFRSMTRNSLRTALTYLATFVLVLVVTMVWSVLDFLNKVTADKDKDFKVVVTEKFQIPSQMPPAYADRIKTEAFKLPEGMRPTEADVMTWAFVGCTLDPTKVTFENALFFFAMDPTKVLTMMDGTDEWSAADAAKARAVLDEMAKNPRGIIVGKEVLKRLNKKVGERMNAASINYKGLSFELDILGTFPEGRYDQNAVMNREALDRAMDDYKRKNGTNHPLAERSLNLVWVRLPSKEAYARFGEALGSPGKFSSPAVKVELGSSAIGSFLDAYKSLLDGMRYLLAPAILVTMSLVISGAISISVRERRTEMAVLKVLGFQPWHLLALVLGEAVLIGAISGGLSSGLTHFLVNNVVGGIKFPIGFFPAFFIPNDALWWGPAIGAGTAVLGSFMPAWSARTVKVSDVFSKVA